MARSKNTKAALAASVENTATEATPAIEATAPVTTVEIVAPAKAAKAPRAARIVQNGVAQPHVGGECRKIWDFCASENAKGTLPTVKQVKAYAEAEKMNQNNASIEYYQWRKFTGVRGRQKVTAPVLAPLASNV